LVVGFAVGMARAQSGGLEAGAALFDRQEYVAAQEALLKVDREKLSEDQRVRLDELLAILPEAIQGADRAGQALNDADKAFDAGEWKKAEALYRDVYLNQYANATQRDRAGLQRIKVAEQLTATNSNGTSEARVQVRSESTVAQSTAPAATPAPPPAPAPSGNVSDEAPRRLTPTEQLRMRDELLWQRAVAQAQALSDRAREAMANNDYVEAKRLVDTAIQGIEAARMYAEPADKYEKAREQLERLQEELKTAGDAYSQTKAAEEREAIAKRLVERREQLERQRRETVEQLFNSAEQLRRERKFGEAAEVLRQILLIDPGNAKARDQLDVAEDYESFAEQSDRLRDSRVETRRALTKAEEALIPWDHDVLYPKNWIELTARRGQKGILQGSNPQTAELNRRLDEVMPEVRFDQTPFEQALAFLTDQTGSNVTVDWEDLDTALVERSREKPISMRLSRLPFKTVLNELLSQAGGQVPLGYAIGDGVLRIATKEKLGRDKLVFSYDVRDLLGDIPQAPQPKWDKPLVGADGGGGGRSSLFSDISATGPETDSRNLGGEKMTQLKSIIRATVEPDSWMDTGAGPTGGTMQDLNGQLIVYNTSAAHSQIVNLLGELRKTQALQISVESRFLDVLSNFLESFGIDLDFVFNAGNAGYDRAPGGLIDPFTGAAVLIPREYSRIGELPVSPGFGTPMVTQSIGQPYSQPGLVPARGGVIPQIEEMTPIGAQQNSLSLVDPSQIATGVPGSWTQRAGLAPALSIAGSFLDNLQVDFLIRATQANSRSSIVQAPRQVMLNGQAVVITIETFRRYISSLEPVVGDNVGLPRPIPDNAQSGLQVWVQGVVSEDRRYTTLSIAFRQRGEATFERYELQRGSGNSPSIFLLLPTQSEVTYTATVSIPDGGTVLLGGFKQVGEVEVEAGVPILSKIPVLKRAFTNNTTVKDARTLLILVKTKIIIQQEAEQEAFPTFSGVEG
jgi:general secretion pathway protein D